MTRARAAFAPLGTSRLSMVHFALDHAEAVYALASDPEHSRAVAAPRHESIEDSRRFIARALVGYANGGYYDWALLRRSDLVFVGSCGFGAIDRCEAVAEIGYELGKPYWGFGYATEAVSATLDFGFVRLGLQAIEAQAFPGNEASLKVMAKLGMRYIGTRAVGPETRRRVRAYRIERERWFDRQPALSLAPEHEQRRTPDRTQGHNSP